MRADRLEFSVNDAVYSYEIQGAGVPVVMLHGFTGSTATWSSFVSKWKSRFQIITIDLPGHGKTTTKTPRTMESFCDDLRELLNHLDLPAVHLAGYSMGGRTALSFSMLYPEMIQSLILESASPGLELSEERETRMNNDEKLAQLMINDGLEKFIQFWENIPLFHTQKLLPEEIQKAIRNERLAQSAEGLADSLRFMGTGKQPSWWNDLKKFAKPVYLLVGDEDKKFVAINQKMKKHFPQCDLAVVPNAGHAIHVEKPSIFGKLVAEFILNNT